MVEQCSNAAVQRLQSNHSLLLAAIADIREKLVRPNQRLQGAERRVRIVGVERRVSTLGQRQHRRRRRQIRRRRRQSERRTRDRRPAKGQHLLLDGDHQTPDNRWEESVCQRVQRRAGPLGPEPVARAGGR